MRAVLVCSALGLWFQPLSAQPSDAIAPTPIDIIRRSVERDWTDFAARTNYTYKQTVETREFNKNRSLARSRSETHEVMILEGRPYERLIARDGQPLSAKEAAKEQEKVDRELKAREAESAGEIARYQRRRAADREFIREIPDAFTFRLLGTEMVSGQPAWMLDAEPRPGFRPKHSDARLFQKVRAKIWIEQATYHWVKMDAEALAPLSFGFGLLRVDRGATIHYEQIRVNDEIWLPSWAVVRADARLALVKKMRAEFDVRYSDYRKFQTESRIEGVDKP